MTDYSISRQLSFEKNTLDSISAFIDHDLNSHTYITEEMEFPKNQYRRIGSRKKRMFSSRVIEGNVF